jgi:signal transduction histidine kinase
MFVLASAGPIVYRLLQRKAEAVLLARQRAYQKFLLSAAKGMAHEHDLSRLLKLMVHVIKAGVKCEFAGVFLFDAKNNKYVLNEVREHDALPKGMTLAGSHPVIGLLKQAKVPLSYEDIAHLFFEDYPGVPIYLMIPAFDDKELIGFLVLGQKVSKAAYTDDDVNVFSILAEQAALAIDHCMFMKTFKDSQERVAETEKLASIGGMAAGIAHQFRNRLNALSVVSTSMSMEIDLFKKSHENISAEEKELFDVLLGMSHDLSSEVKRSAQVVDGVVKFSKEQQTETDFSLFSLMDVIDSAMWPFRLKHNLVDRELPFELIVDLPQDDKIYGIKGNMDEVMFNLIDNAHEAIDEKARYKLTPQEKESYKPFLKIELIPKEEANLIRISDNGVGIKEEDRLRIFSPFFTTKISAQSGMGIGMYVIRRMIVTGHKGKAWFESKYLEGTTFYIELPKGKKDVETN